MKKWCFLLLFASLLASCSKSANGNEGKNVLHAKLEKTEVSLKDLFSKIEVIPLETNDTALMDRIRRVREVDGITSCPKNIRDSVTSRRWSSMPKGTSCIPSARKDKDRANILG